ncbi:hypothetical protein DB43_FB00090 [Parachlamydia acanthamoebae]|nr:hypothetical protein DB43_FB00090 [Parachlamydia acanthamoebae]
MFMQVPPNLHSAPLDYQAFSLNNSDNHSQSITYVKIYTLDGHERVIDNRILDNLGILKEIFAYGESDESKLSEARLKFSAAVLDFVIDCAIKKNSENSFYAYFQPIMQNSVSLLPEIYQFASFFSIEYLQVLLLTISLGDNLPNEYQLKQFEEIVNNDAFDLNQRKYACYMLITCNRSNTKVKEQLHKFMSLTTESSIEEIFGWIMGPNGIHCAKRQKCLYYFFEVLSDKDYLSSNPSFLLSSKDTLPQRFNSDLSLSFTDALPKLYEQGDYLVLHSFISLAKNIRDPFLAKKLFEIIDSAANISKSCLQDHFDWGSLILNKTIEKQEASLVFSVQESVFASFAFHAMIHNISSNQAAEVSKTFCDCILNIETKGLSFPLPALRAPPKIWTIPKNNQHAYILNTAFHSIFCTFQSALQATKDPEEWLKTLVKFLHIYQGLQDSTKKADPYYLYNSRLLQTFHHLDLSQDNEDHQRFLKDFIELLDHFRLITLDLALDFTEYEDRFPEFVQAMQDRLTDDVKNNLIMHKEHSKQKQEFDYSFSEKVIEYLRLNQIDAALCALRDEENRLSNQKAFDKIAFRTMLMQEILKGENGLANALELNRRFGKKTRNMFLEVIINDLEHAQTGNKLELFSELLGRLELLHDSKLKQKFYIQLIHYACKQPIKISLEIGNKFFLPLQNYQDEQSFPVNLIDLLEYLLIHSKQEECLPDVLKFVEGFHRGKTKKGDSLKNIKDRMIPSLLAVHLIRGEAKEVHRLLGRSKTHKAVLYPLNKALRLLADFELTQSSTRCLNEIVFNKISAWKEAYDALGAKHLKIYFENESKDIFTFLLKENTKALQKVEAQEERNTYLKKIGILLLNAPLMAIESKIKCLETIFALYPINVTQQAVKNICFSILEKRKRHEAASLGTFLGERALASILPNVSNMFQFSEMTFPFIKALKMNGYTREFLDHVLSRNLSFNSIMQIMAWLPTTSIDSFTQTKRKFEFKETKIEPADSLSKDSLEPEEPLAKRKRKDKGKEKMDE